MIRRIGIKIGRSEGHHTTKPRDIGVATAMKRVKRTTSLVVRGTGLTAVIKVGPRASFLEEGRYHGERRTLVEGENV